MKRMLGLAMGGILFTLLLACGIHVAAMAEHGPQGKVLLLADGADISEYAAQYEVWQGLCSYAEEYGYEACLIQAPDARQADRMRALENQLSPAVRVVVAVGEDYGPVIYEAQQRHPELSFLLVEGEPHRLSDSVYETKTNTHCLLFHENEAGFLAGFSAVMEGKRRLGFCAEGNGADAIRYGYGMIQGAEAAAASLGLANGAVEIRYAYVEQGADQAEPKNMAAQWYEQGTELISVFDRGELSLIKSVIAVAEEKGGLVFLSDAGRGIRSRAVLGVTARDCRAQVWEALDSFEKNGGHWNPDRAGRSFVSGIAEGTIGLPREDGEWRFSAFSKEAYEALLQQMKQGCFPLDAGGNRECFPLSPHCTVRTQNS